MAETVFATCSLCEATCGLKFEVQDNRVLSVRPDDDDVFSQGYVCPKGIAIADIHHDPDRLRRPVRKNAAGQFEEISWDEAFELVAGRLGAIRAQHGPNAIGFYWGNPTGNNHGALLMLSSFTKALGTRNRFSSGSQDANPRIVASYELYGSSISIPIPDIDRTDYFLCLGGNPMVSNGSVMTAPDMRRRLRAVRERGGRVVVVDPRRTETAKEADEHVAIRPGGDAAFLLAMVQVLIERGRIDRQRLERTTTGWAEIERRLAAFTPARVAAFTGVPAETITRLALEFADARSAVCYSRVGVCVGAHATIATFATDLLNIVTGRLGSEGGPMFTTPRSTSAASHAWSGLDGRDRWRSRVGDWPETLGDLPSVVLADEIETPGDGQIRAMVTFAGNPVLSAPNGRRIAAAFEKIEFMVSIDIYINETTRHADVILPPCWNLAEDHIDLLFSSVAVRNIARWSPPVVEPEDGEKSDWEILLELTERLGGGPLGDVWGDRILRWLRPLGVRWTPTGFLDLMLRLGPYGDRFLPWSDGLSLAKLRAAPHGIDLGPLQPGIERRPLPQGQAHPPDVRVHGAGDGCARARPRIRGEGERPRPHRPARAPQQQLVDAQRAGAGLGTRALRALRASGRRRALRGPRRRDGDAREPRASRRGAGRGHGRHAPGCGQPAARLGARRQRAVAERGRESRRRVGQRLGGRRRRRADHRAVDSERRAGHAGAAPVSEHIQPPGLFPGAKLGFTQVVTATAKRLIWIAGQTACDQRGRPLGGDDVGAQAEAALDNLRQALEAAGRGPPT
jgi:formylmethanofuran dehydrogenase subunit B/enamine deaminase RidA (YjgF/YER057c/UK114 family)